MRKNMSFTAVKLNDMPVPFKYSKQLQIIFRLKNKQKMKSFEYTATPAGFVFRRF
jgi:hypothetical protein